MPKASINNKKLTNMTLGSGEHIMAIRRNPESDSYADEKLAGDAMEMPIGRPLRYTPGLKCDAHLESLRPERSGVHRPIQVHNAKISNLATLCCSEWLFFAKKFYKFCLLSRQFAKVLGYFLPNC